jgi:calcineurin-like phosphoesterase
MDKDNPIHSFVKGYRADGRFKPSEGIGKICGSFIESDDNTGLAKKIEAFQI